MLIITHPPSIRLDRIAVERIEKQFDGSFPRDYIEFLESTNGGLIYPVGKLSYCFKYVPPGASASCPALLNSLFSIGIGDNAASPYSDAENAYKNLLKADPEYPRDFFPIGDADSGMIIGLYLKGNMRGTIFSFLQDYGFSEGYRCKLANSFTEFSEGVELIEI